MGKGAERLDLIEVRRDLRPDCSRCAGLCCVAPTFAASEDFAIDKPAGRACPHLRADFGCGIHADLRERGFPGCAVFDCFGAGQQVVQRTFGGTDWREAPELAASMFTVFGVVRQLKELLWYLSQALTLLPAGPRQEEVDRAYERTRLLVDGSIEHLASTDPATIRAEFGPLLAEVSETLRADVPGRAPDRTGADLIGADLAGEDLRGVSLRGAYLLGADLTGADLTRADLLGTDLRGAYVSGARLAESLFLTQPQLDAARGDSATRLPPWFDRPRHWSPGTVTRPKARRNGPRRGARIAQERRRG